MKNPSSYLKMRVLGAIDMAEGHCIQARIKAVAATSFTDEQGHARQFTWRTIQTWYSRYKKHGVTALENAPRSDKTTTRKVKPEQLLEAIRAVLPKAHGKTPTRATLYRLCIEQGVLTRQQVAPNTFTRLVKRFELLKADRRWRGQAPARLRQGPRQRIMAGRHALRPACAASGCAGPDPPDRVP
jgi:transposase